MNQQTKTGYLIRATASNPCYGNGYPIFVDALTLHKALLTGDYTYDITDTEAREIDVDIQYRDERLN